MTSYHAGQLVKTAKKTYVTKPGTLKLVEEKFDGKMLFNYNDITIVISLIFHHYSLHFAWIPIYQVDNSWSVARASAIGVEGEIKCYGDLFEE